ncbi:Pex24p-domain-containing protein [Teratosphaeria nubilosa]|uniref:Pex24p-domain-containing protein n=1 Tax=Teratosphaeria nubilosa TaxID=161662 RepID=A0A6G1LFH6_9PEZI|nr:Pex24p-domain-containing protein [Teratosphaeria nubilosa]
MAAFETPWTDLHVMSSTYPSPSRIDGAINDDALPSSSVAPGQKPTVAAFAPNQQTASKPGHTRGASVLIHQKTPLLVATPPHVTRALAYSHPFILPLNHVAGLLSWTTGDPWESFLLVSAFWFCTLYGDAVIRWAGPLVVVVGLIAGMYCRRYSPLSSRTWSGEKVKKKESEKQRKSLDEILDTLQTFTGRCDVLLDPFLRMTEFLSTQSSATSATTRPALTTLFLRILAFTPVWILLTVPPLYILTTKRIILSIGTLGLTWHSRPARITRTILWRSRTVRRISSAITGLQFIGSPMEKAPPLPPRKGPKATALNGKAEKPGIRFTFTLWENQRRWVGLGWTNSLLTYERQNWTDEHMNTESDPGHFELPETDHGTTKWRWAPGSEWRVEGAPAVSKDSKEKSAKRIGGGGGADDRGWIYYDNKWQGPSKVDGWGRYTRRRKWVRDAELVEIEKDESAPGDDTARTYAETDTDAATLVSPSQDPDAGPETASLDITASPRASSKKKGWFGRPRAQRSNTTESKADTVVSKSGSHDSASSRDGPDEDHHTPLRYREVGFDRSIGEGIAEGLS